MVRQDKHKSRVTPKGTKPHSSGSSVESDVDHSKSGVSRTPVKYSDSSPRWVPALMFGLFGVGIVAIMLPYLFTDITGGSWWILGGLGMVLGGIITATQYR